MALLRKIAAEVLATMITTYTFASASARDAFRTKINSYFAESEKIKKQLTMQLITQQIMLITKSTI